MRIPEPSDPPSQISKGPWNLHFNKWGGSRSTLKAEKHFLQCGWSVGVGCRPEKAKEEMLDPAPSTQTRWELQTRLLLAEGDASDGEQGTRRQRGNGGRREGDTQSKQPQRKQTWGGGPPHPPTTI